MFERSLFYFVVDVHRDLDDAKQGFTAISLSLLANYRKQQQLRALLKSLHTIKTLVSTSRAHIECHSLNKTFTNTFFFSFCYMSLQPSPTFLLFLGYFSHLRCPFISFIQVLFWNQNNLQIINSNRQSTKH